MAPAERPLRVEIVAQRVTTGHGRGACWGIHRLGVELWQPWLPRGQAVEAINSAAVPLQMLILVLTPKASANTARKKAGGLRIRPHGL